MHAILWKQISNQDKCEKTAKVDAGAEKARSFPELHTILPAGLGGNQFNNNNNNY